MKRNTFTNWLAFLIIAILSLTNTHPAIASGTSLKNSNPDTTATTASWATTAPEMAPWLVKWDEKGNVIKQYILAFEVSGNDTIFFSRRCACKIEANRVRWYPRFNPTDGDSRVVFAQKSANTANFSLYVSEEYSSREADSLYRKFPTKAENAIILANSPRSKRLARLESDVAQLKSDVAQIKAQLLGDSTSNNDAVVVTKTEFTEEISQIREAFETNGLFNQAVDEHLSATKGRQWTRTKHRYGIVVLHDDTKVKEVVPTSEMPMPMPRRW